MNFPKWLKKVEQQVMRITDGYVTLVELPDMDYRGMFDRGFTPKRAAWATLYNAGYGRDQEDA